MKRTKFTRAFTLIELLVVISIIAILAGIALPVFGQVQERAAQTKALANIKQIALACKLFAMDYDGYFPSKQLNAAGERTSTDESTANAVFRQLIPAYVKTEQPFYVPKSAFTPTKPDEKFDTAANKLAAGENHWAYVLNLSDSSTSTFPLIADGFSSSSQHTYVEVESAKGGIWKGKKAIVARVDGSAEGVRLTTDTLKVPGSPNGLNLFDTGQSANGWLGTTNTVVNPE